VPFNGLLGVLIRLSSANLENAVSNRISAAVPGVSRMLAFLSNARSTRSAGGQSFTITADGCAVTAIGLNVTRELLGLPVDGRTRVVGSTCGCARRFAAPGPRRA